VIQQYCYVAPLRSNAARHRFSSSSEAMFNPQCPASARRPASVKRGRRGEKKGGGARAKRDRRGEKKGGASMRQLARFHRTHYRAQYSINGVRPHNTTAAAKQNRINT